MYLSYFLELGEFKIGTGVEAVVAMFAIKLWGNLQPVEKMANHLTTFWITMKLNMIEEGKE